MHKFSSVTRKKATFSDHADASVEKHCNADNMLKSISREQLQGTSVAVGVPVVSSMESYGNKTIKCSSEMAFNVLARIQVSCATHYTLCDQIIMTIA